MSLTQILHTFDDEKEIVKEDKKYVEKDKGVKDLKGILQRKRLKLVKESTPIRRGVSFAPYAITYSYCRRLKIGQLAGFIEIFYDKNTPKVQTGFDLGTILHDLVQSYFWNVGMLKGTYECLKCDKLYHELVAPTECPSGIKSHKRKHLRYREVVLRNEEYSLSGRTDGILIVEENEELLEIKSLGARTVKTNGFGFSFEDLDTQGPRENHIIQLMIYMFMAKIYTGHLLYISKNDGQMKTYKIEFDSSIIQPYLNEIEYLKTTAQSLKEGKTVTLPECCADSECACHTILGKMS